MRLPRLVPPVTAVVLLLALAGCSSPSPDDGSDTAPGSGGATISAGPSEAPVGGDDAAAPAAGATCGLASAAVLTAALGTDPGAGAEESDVPGLTSCDWTVDDSPVALLQVGEAARFFPADMYPQPEGATALDGVDTGWASAEQRTVFLIEDGIGLTFNAFLFGTEPGDQDAWVALGQEIAGNL